MKSYSGQLLIGNVLFRSILTLPTCFRSQSSISLVPLILLYLGFRSPDSIETSTIQSSSQSSISTSNIQGVIQQAGIKEYLKVF